MSLSLAQMLAAPELVPHALDETGRRIMLLQLDEATIREASFLDQRVVGAKPRGTWQLLEPVLAAIPADTPDDADYVFHLGHVGSTLIARLLGAVEGVLALREPQILRALADVAAPGDAADALWAPATVAPRIAALRRLLARRFRPGQRTIVKATSFVNAIAPALVAPGARATFLTASAPSYLATILAGENSRREAAVLAPRRLARLERLLPGMPWRAWSLGEGETIALGWLVEILSLNRAEAALAPGSVLRADFDCFLERPADGLLEIARHHRLDLMPNAATALVTGPLMQRYSKAPEHAYSAQLRRDLQREARMRHGETLSAGLAWLAQCAHRYPAAAQALEKETPRCSS